MAQAKPACGSHPRDCNAGVLSIQYNCMFTVHCTLSTNKNKINNSDRPCVAEGNTAGAV